MNARNVGTQPQLEAFLILVDWNIPSLQGLPQWGNTQENTSDLGEQSYLQGCLFHLLIMAVTVY